ncbi:MAG: DUF692 domain-containing protein [Candidatus Obscuribacterales bacterium]|jgi:uncharacterized protein (UPF0276 family)|nr:DUF692 domain-containing protein [Candidatus Obscuribacterales bacterium]
MTNQFHELKKKMPVVGVGLGYREEIADHTIENKDSIDFLEVISDHYLNFGPVEMKDLEKARDFQIIPHGIELSIGNTGEVDVDYLKKLNKFLQSIDAPWWSDHLCFTGVQGNRLHDLLPLPHSKEAVEHVVRRIKKVREYIEIPLLLENISSYLVMPGSEMTEAQFVGEIIEQADCGLLLDVNNLYVNSVNHNFDAMDYLDSLPIERVVQVHVAGHRRVDNLLIDTHGARISKPVFDLLSEVVSRTEVKAILLERDQLFPRFSSILAELDKIREVAGKKQASLAKPLDNVLARAC